MHPPPAGQSARTLPRLTSLADYIKNASGRARVHVSMFVTQAHIALCVSVTVSVCVCVCVCVCVSENVRKGRRRYERNSIFSVMRLLYIARPHFCNRTTIMMCRFSPEPVISENDQGVEEMSTIRRRRDG